MAEVLEVASREAKGSAEARRLRRAGAVPGILYGHGEPVVNVSVPSVQLAAAVRHGARMVELTGAVKTKAMIKALQWDTFHTAVQHIDFFRVSAGEEVEVSLTVRPRGEAVGARSGGSVEVVRHELKVRCPVDEIPEAIDVDVSALEVGDAIRVEDLSIPGLKLLDDAHDVVVHCVGARAEEEEVAEAGEVDLVSTLGRRDDDPAGVGEVLDERTA